VLAFLDFHKLSNRNLKIAATKPSDKKLVVVADFSLRKTPPTQSKIAATPALPYLKCPRAIVFFGVVVRGTADAGGADAPINGFGKLAVFNNSHRFTGKVGKPPPFSGRLHPTVVHPKHKATLALLYDFLFIQPTVKAIF